MSKDDLKISLKTGLRGGLRTGAGRPKGQGKYQEPTKPIRVPVSILGKVQDFVENKGYEIPLYLCAVSAGYPSAADDHVAENIDLNKYLVKHPTATFLVRVVGDSMVNAGINQSDVLVVDRSIEARSGRIVVAAINGELTVKRLSKTNEGVYLLPENDNYEPIKIEEGNENIVWGVVTNVIHKF